MHNFNFLLTKFNSWLDEAKQHPQVVEPTAMCLATVNIHGQPSARMVLLKKVNEQGFYFFTNDTSRKGQEIQQNRQASICFYWAQLKKQIRITGNVIDASVSESDEYFASRPRQSQIGAWASHQSTTMNNWQDFADNMVEFEHKFTNQQVPRPPFWRGFIVVPQTIEFWQEQDFRLHHRFLYTKQADSTWQVQQLYP
jgi:pyridoxamine 5'-phosphate oxidase